MTDPTAFQEELDYFVDYTRTSLVYFSLIRDSAEQLAGDTAPEETIRTVTLDLIAGMIDQGVAVGDIGPADGADLLPWALPKAETLRRIAQEMAELDDPDRFIDICWFRMA
ncbi:hypothetical protein [Kitasatospora viridis]|uniref:Uncharacterized protein n=1 Tax=Kitasatospora viridis TaxID=281105 RepID=A0A561SES2_9ACTN|nr:hypothetical protein [Kitasatospora viridis]TWF73359.1 hypothetical protein FHX73_16510 [Kitasatospora viridis]